MHVPYGNLQVQVEVPIRITLSKKTLGYKIQLVDHIDLCWQGEGTPRTLWFKYESWIICVTPTLHRLPDKFGSSF